MEHMQSISKFKKYIYSHTVAAFKKHIKDKENEIEQLKEAGINKTVNYILESLEAGDSEWLFKKPHYDAMAYTNYYYEIHHNNFCYKLRFEFAKKASFKMIKKAYYDVREEYENRTSR